MTYFQFIRLVGYNLDVVQPLAELIQHRQMVSGLEARWNVDKQIGDLLVPRIAAMVAPIAAAEEEDESDILIKLNQAPTAQAWDGSRLRKLFEIALPIIDLFTR